jgi:predicted nuclease of predicted toxin-antitoxin system
MQPEWIFWLDNYFSPIIAKWINERTPYSCKSSYSLELKNLTDLQVYQKARMEGDVILISKDSDLPQLILLYGSPPKLINIRRGNCSNKTMFSLLEKNIEHCYKMLVDFNHDIIEIS